MARKRMIDPNIWQSEDFSKLSTLGKLVFIGLFSLADDEGRGRSNPVYLKSTLFPYEEGIRSADIDKTLSEISSNMSVIFYSCNGSSYYSLYNWNTWQKIDRPSESKIPEYNSQTMQELFDESSAKARRVVAPKKNRKRIEKEIKENEEKEFIPPSFEDIEKYILEKKLQVDAKKFYDYFTEGNWVDSNGKRVKNWKQKILTWNGYSTKPKQEKKSNFDEREYEAEALNSLYANV